MTRYWFRKRRGLLSRDLGFGWVPISWEGWLITLGFILWVFALVASKNAFKPLTIFYILLLIILFAFIADLKSEDKVIFK